MATTPVADPLAERIIPKEFYRGDDLNKFIKQCERYFLVRGTTNEKVKENTMFCLLDVDLHKEYEETEGKVSGFAARLRLAFEEPRDVLHDMRQLLNYRKGNEKSGRFIERVESLVKKLLSHELTEEKLTALFLVHAAGSKEIEEEVVMKKLDKVEDIKEVIKLREKLEEKTMEINTMRSYANVTRNNGQPIKGTMYSERRPTPSNGPTRSPRCYNCNRTGHEATNCRTRRPIECWTCKKEGHISRNCPERMPQTCYACGKAGHIRRDCREVQCTRCHRNGHLRANCYTRLERGQEEKNRNSRNHQYRRIAAIGEGYEEHIEDEEVVNSIQGDEYETRNPKVRAPLVGEIVGAIN